VLAGLAGVAVGRHSRILSLGWEEL
jgi:hypothetical protein